MLHLRSPRDSLPEGHPRRLKSGELPGAPVIGELVPRRNSVLIIW